MPWSWASLRGGVVVAADGGRRARTGPRCRGGRASSGRPAHEEFAVGCDRRRASGSSPDAVRLGRDVGDRPGAWSRTAERGELARRTDAYGSRLVDADARRTAHRGRRRHRDRRQRVGRLPCGARRASGPVVLRGRRSRRARLAPRGRRRRLRVPAPRIADFWAVGRVSTTTFAQTSDREVVVLRDCSTAQRPEFRSLSLPNGGPLSPSKRSARQGLAQACRVRRRRDRARACGTA